MAMATTFAGMEPKVLCAINHWTSKTLPQAPAENFYIEADILNEMRMSEDFQEGAAAFHDEVTYRNKTSAAITNQF